MRIKLKPLIIVAVALLVSALYAAPASASGKIPVSASNFTMAQGANKSVNLQLSQPIICPGGTVTCEVSLTLTPSDPSNVTLSSNNVDWLSYEWAQTRTITISTASTSVYAPDETVTIQVAVDGDTTAPYYFDAGFSIPFTLTNTNPAPYPSIVNQSFNIIQDSTAREDVLSGVGNSPNPSSLAVNTGPAHGSASVSSGMIAYTPAPGYVGADSLTYQVCSTVFPGICSTAVLSFNVLAKTASPTGVSSAGAIPSVPDTGYGGSGSANVSSIIALFSTGVILIAGGLILRSKHTH